MPEMHFRVRWPDGSRMRCYSPSSTLRDAFTLNTPYPLQDFVERSRVALEHASARVAQKYGFGCGQALAQIQEIERAALQFAEQPDASVVVEAFED